MAEEMTPGRVMQDAGGAHEHGKTMSFEEAVKASLERSAEQKRKIAAGEQDVYVYPGKPKRRKG